MIILVVNCGSSSLKFQLFDMNKEEVMTSGLIERIGIEGSRMILKTSDGTKHTTETKMDNHSDALKILLEGLVKEEYNIISSLSEINAVGHRVVHGGESYSKSIVVDENVSNAIRDCFELAPLHNPPNLLGIEAIQELMPGVPNVAVFDTAFHQTVPEEAYIYPVPYEWYTNYKIRRYGFHGTSHKFVANKLAKELNKDVKDMNIVTCHLGNGSSISAVAGGESVDTSMGFTPLAGLPMGTRCGDIDPAICTYIIEKENLSAKELDTLLNKKSGVLGISGVSSDFRDLNDAKAEGNKRADLALKIFRREVKKTIASYAAIMGGIDAVIFTGGIGENGIEDREEILSGLEFMGIELDKEKNKVRGEFKEISSDNSKVGAYVVPTNEELAIALDTLDLIK